MNLKKNLKFLIGGLTLAICTVVVIFAALPSHAQADEAAALNTEIVANETETSNELCVETKDCSAECMKNKACEPECKVTCE